MYIYDVFLDNSNQGSNTSQLLHHIVSLDIPCRRCSRACKGTPRRSRSCSRSPWQKKKLTLEKNTYGEKKLGWKKTDLSRCETAGVTIGRSASLASFFSTHRWGKNGEQKQERKAFHFSVNGWKLLGETKYWYEKVSLSFSLLHKTEKSLLFHSRLSQN